MPADQAYEVWRALMKPDQLTDDQKARLGKIEKVWLDWHTAPDAYVKANLEWIIPMAVSEWTVDPHGRIGRPQDEFGWNFAHRWGLWYKGQPTLLARNPAAGLQTSLVPDP